MANDRLYLVCPGCGEGFMLAKRMGDAWYVAQASEAHYVSRLDDFFSHCWECMAGVVADPHKLLLMNEMEHMGFEQTRKKLDIGQK